MWKSVAARVSWSDKTVVYLWQGWYSSGKDVRPQDRFHGYGELEFELPMKEDDPISRGSGKFWDVQENHPEKTTVKVALGRRASQKEVAVMQSGKQKEIRDLIGKTFRDWY